MPLLLNVLRNANSASYGKIRVKAMECAGLIGTCALIRFPYPTNFEVHLQPSPWDAMSSSRMPVHLSNSSSKYKVSANDACAVRSISEFLLDSPVDPSDTLLANYLIATWAKVCQALGPDFEPYLPVVMPPLINAASAKADVTIYGMFAWLLERCAFEHSRTTPL